MPGGIGMLDIFVFKGNGMVKMDVTGLCDPYVALTVTNNDGVGGKTRKTQFIRQNINPEWNAAFTFEVTSPSQILVIKVYDHDDLGLDDLMGSRSIPMDEVISKDWSEEILMLDGEGHEIIGEDGTMCRVRLDLKYTPHPKKEQAALRRDIYRQSGVGEVMVKEAIKRAAGSDPQKRVLIQFGADWNDSCKKFNWFLAQADHDCVAYCQKYYSYLILDAEHEANFDIMKRLGEPQWLGFPVFVILDHRGAYIHTQSAGPLEMEPIFTATEPDPDKIINFLRYWRAGGENDIVEEEGRGQASVKSHLSSLLESESTESPLSPNDK